MSERSYLAALAAYVLVSSAVLAGLSIAALAMRMSAEHAVGMGWVGGALIAFGFMAAVVRQ
ncbi:MAG: hypothetical protein ACOY5U_09445 [Pseudomonadota bacterium]